MADGSSFRKRPFQFSLRQLLLVVTGCAVLLALGVLLFRQQPRPPDWLYEGQLHEAIAGADRIVVREGGFAWSGTGPQYRVLFEVTDAVEIKAVFGNLEFQAGQYAEVCGCEGHPELHWYQGDRCLAATRVKHGEAIHWDELPGQADLTEKSSQWLAQWLVGHGIAQATFQ
jgi:hypothetical protein